MWSQGRSTLVDKQPPPCVGVYQGCPGALSLSAMSRSLTACWVQRWQETQRGGKNAWRAGVTLRWTKPVNGNWTVAGSSEGGAGAAAVWGTGAVRGVRGWDRPAPMKGLEEPPTGARTKPGGVGLVAPPTPNVGERARRTPGGRPLERACRPMGVAWRWMSVGRGCRPMGVDAPSDWRVGEVRVGEVKRGDTTRGKTGGVVVPSGRCWG